MKLTNLTADNKDFVCRVLAKQKTKPHKPNRKTKPFIDRWIIRYYDSIFAILNKYAFITLKGISSIDRLNEAIQSIYYDPNLSFKSQKEADEFLSRELCWKRFIIKLRIN